ncbi:MAG: peptide chain release factor 2 [Candidatus Omnitrophica bacterium]|nr:peptide chain release factor 2 [Candidatus Omnitrophota bacterium]MDE2223486.1 peptide chain release factor 2 [Candidatus Omnitrophota bacterium]
MFDLPQKEKAIADIQDRMSAEGFWDNQDKANKVMQELKGLKTIVEPFQECVKSVNDAKEFLGLGGEDEDLNKQLAEEAVLLDNKIKVIELQAHLSGPFDGANALLSINAGAGGTESCDWAAMLMRMYTRHADLKGYKCEAIDVLYGDEAGIKNATLRIEGDKAYGYLKSEKGVHRLVRISPFDANKRRHTSFASVEVIPEVEDDTDVEINPSELRIDVYRASGPGGQGVNTTDSAVRITHLPTGIVAQSQKERSQLQNKAFAMKVLRARLAALKARQQEEAMNKEAGDKQKIEWGSQIRSYVLYPYQMVKDHRTGVETSATTKVLDGEIDAFIEGFLKTKPEDRDKRLRARGNDDV